MRLALTTADTQLAARHAELSVLAEVRQYPLRCAAALLVLALMFGLVVTSWIHGQAAITALALLGASIALGAFRSANWRGALGQGLMRARGVYTRAAHRKIICATTAAARSAAQLAARIASNASRCAARCAAAIIAALLRHLGLISTQLTARLAPAPRRAPGNLARAS